MRKSYEKPTILVDRNLAEGVYLASGQNAGTLNVSYMGVMDRWNGGGKGYVSVDWSGISGTVQLSIVFNDTIDQVEDKGTGFCLRQDRECYIQRRRGRLNDGGSPC